MFRSSGLPYSLSSKRSASRLPPAVFVLDLYLPGMGKFGVSVHLGVILKTVPSGR